MCRDDPGKSVMMVNHIFANTYFGGAPVVGRRLGPPSNPYLPTVYVCGGAMQPGLYFLARTHGEPMALAETVRRKLHELESLRSVYDISALTNLISDSYAENRLRTVLLTFFALTAVALAGVGLYGTLSYMVNVRKREVGLRLALGALRGQSVRQFLIRGLRDG